MIEYLPIPAIIIGTLLYARWKKSYLSQVIIVANFLISMYYFIFVHFNPHPIYEPGLLKDAFAFVPARFGQIEYIPSIITSMFMHAGPLHLIGNVLILYLLGLPLEERIGSRNFGIIYFITGIAATMSFYLLHMDSTSYLLGASGAIFGIGGAFLILYPKDKIPMLIGPIFTTRAPVWLAVGVMFVVESFLVAISVQDNVAHIAHVGGIVCGVLIAPIIVKKREEASTSKLDFGVLRQMALTEDDLLIVDKIENEAEKDVQEAWLDFFFQNVARCPKCKRHVQRADEIVCECGQVTRIMKQGD